jgi:hypothetical protein
MIFLLPSFLSIPISDELLQGEVERSQQSTESEFSTRRGIQAIQTETEETGSHRRNRRGDHGVLSDLGKRSKFLSKAN